MKKMLMLAAAVGALLTTGVAEARVGWSIGLAVPGVATVVSNGPVYAGAPVYVAPPVVYAPVPRYVPAPVVSYVPAPVGFYGAVPFYRRAPLIVDPGWQRHDFRR